jgi:hypothetical protein
MCSIPTVGAAQDAAIDDFLTSNLPGDGTRPELGHQLRLSSHFAMLATVSP